ncbi:hypothetical protein FS749_015341 [Ceratobasidium sp. UAMH 11750]|nr:hypothetical protein FS749_015341 [Ceratobasidium sp. UAMH 11750]
MIRNFSFDVSEMTKFAARDYEDVLQCFLPAIEGLFTDEQHRRISALVFTFAKWHTLAKLRMHTESTLQVLELETRVLAQRLRLFQQFIAIEFPLILEISAEFEVQKRREIRAAAARNIPLTKELTKEVKHLHLNTPKFYALGNYPQAIQMFGTTDSYSTRIGELKHRRVKARARRTNQNDIARGIATIKHQETRLIAQARALENLEHQPRRSTAHLSSESAQTERVLADAHHRIAHKSGRVRFIDFFHEHKADPAINVMSQK